MRDAKMAILEDQLDALAGRVGDAEERLTLLVRLLTSKNVAARERRSRLAKAELDDFRRRVANAEMVADLTGTSFIEAWDTAREDEDDVEDDAGEDQRPIAARPDSTVWDKALAHLATVVNRYSFVMWFEETSLVRDDGKTLVVRTADRLAAAWLEKQYAEVVKAALATVGRPETSVQFVTGEDEEEDS